MLPTTQTNNIVSIIIPCYNHGTYLARAVESILAQDYTQFEIIVVDDGSKDNTPEVSGQFPAVKYIYQVNQGLSAARNTGILNSTGDFLVFLDADDWLFPEALSTNLRYLHATPAAGFVSGAFTDMFMHNGKQVKQSVEKDHYNMLLERNYIAMHGAVMYRRWVFGSILYDTSLRACEDYDIYLKIARKYPIIHHTKQIAVYNRHDANMSGNYPLMLESALTVLGRQKDGLRGITEMEHFQRGIQYWKDHYCMNMYANLVSENNAEKSNIKAQLDSLQKHHKDLYLKYHITRPLMLFKKNLIKLNFNFFLKKLYQAGLYKSYIPATGKVAMGDFKRLTPFSTSFGCQRGGPIDRYYIEKFLKKQSGLIGRRVLEIGDDEYTLRFGDNKIKQSDILHVDSSNKQATFVGELSNAPHVPSNSFDCIILAQKLHFIYDCRGALETCYRVLKPGGVLLLTVPGISQIDQGEWKKNRLYSFTDSVITKMLSDIFPVEKIEVETFGNVLVAASFLFGLGLPELSKEQLDYNDPHYQLIITATAVKPL